MDEGLPALPEVNKGREWAVALVKSRQSEVIVIHFTWQKCLDGPVLTTLPVLMVTAIRSGISLVGSCFAILNPHLIVRI